MAKQKRVHAELDEVFGDDEREANESDLKRLVYLERCIKGKETRQPSGLLYGSVRIEFFFFCRDAAHVSACAIRHAQDSARL